MKRRFIVLFTSLFVLQAAAWGDIFAEIEVNDTIGTANVIPAAAFTVPAPPTSFATAPFFIPDLPTVTLTGEIANVFEDAVADLISDVDFFCFTATAGSPFFADVDNAGLPDFDSVLALFDGAGTLLADTDDSSGDPGSTFVFDSFLGTFIIPADGTYYLAISGFSNFPDEGADIGSLIRPDGAFGGDLYDGGSATYTGVEDDEGAYVVHVSLGPPPPVTRPIPEPGTWALFSVGLLGACVLRRKRFAK